MRLLLVLLLATVALGACGKKGSLDWPDGANPRAPTAPKYDDSKVYPGS